MMIAKILKAPNFIGIVSAFFFSLTFVLNELMAKSTGSWIWSAILRYLWMMPLLLLIHFLFSDSFSIKHVIKRIKLNKMQWLIGSHLCFVLFYVPLCFANSIFPGWLTASMWQITIVLGVLISPLINTTKNSRYRIPRQKIPLSILPWLFLILIGVALTVLNYLMVDGVIRNFGIALVMMFVAAISYPMGNRMVMSVSASLNGFERLFGMLVCTYPTWLCLSVGTYIKFGGPSFGQVEATFLVALFSGVIATGLFFHATSLVMTDMKKLANIESTQSMEIIFSILLGIIILGNSLPSFVIVLGVVIIILGIYGGNMNR